MTDDEALIRRAQAGDSRAFEALLEHHYDTVYRFAWKWCGNRDDAQDITQQVCLKLAHALGSFRFESAFSSWLYRLVINCAKDWARSQRRHDGLDLKEGNKTVSDSGAVEHQAYLWEVLQKLNALPKDIKEILLLLHAEGLTHGEVARVLGMKESTVSWRLHEFRKHYRLSLNEGGLCE